MYHASVAKQKITVSLYEFSNFWSFSFFFSSHSYIQIKKSSFSIPIYHIKALTFICKEEIDKNLQINNCHQKPFLE